MLYTPQDSLRNTVLIPRNLTELPSGDYVLKLRSNTNRKPQDPNGADMNADFSFDFAHGSVFKDTALYHSIEWSWPTTPQAGEYSYWLLKGGVIVASGLLMVTKGREKDEYDNSIEYEQYEATNE